MNVRILIYSMLLGLYLVACESDPFTMTVGDEIVEPTTRLVMVDTFSIQLSTVYIDSIRTSGTGTLLAGVCDDDETGRIISKSYFQFGLPNNYNIADNEHYDSISLVLTYNNYSYGDTTLSNIFTIHQLTEELSLNERNYFYNTSSFNYDPMSIGSIRFNPRPVMKHRLEISLKKELGKEMFDYLNGELSDEITETDFLNRYKGMVIVPSETEGNSILGYTTSDSTLYLKIYSHISKLETEYKEIILPMVNNDLQFNQIICDWSNNPVFENNIQKIEIPVSETNNMAFIQGGLGLFTKINFPFLPYIVELSNSILVRALLYFEPIGGNIKDLQSTDEIRIFKTGRNNEMGAVLVDMDGYEIQANFYLDEFYDEETYFVIDITQFMRDELKYNYIYPEMALSVGFSSSYMSKSLDKIILGGSQNELNNLKLELTFLIYDQ
jgi:hypothetical protein